jgi:hypothetical protein
MEIKVKCVNDECDATGIIHDFPESLVMAPGEVVLCGACGHETEFVGEGRPARTLEFNPNMMNKHRVPDKKKE